MNRKRFLSMLLAFMLASSTISPAMADTTVLPSENDIVSMNMISSILEATNEDEAQDALETLSEAAFESKLLALAQIAEYVDTKNVSAELLIGFLPYIGEDLMDGLDAETASAILESEVYGDTFKIYVMDFANTKENFEDNGYNEVLCDLALDDKASEEVRIYAAHNLDTEAVDDPVTVYETLYDDANEIENKMLMLKDIGFVEPDTARELSLDVLNHYEDYENRIVTMANKAYIRSIEGEQEYIDDIVNRNREMMESGDVDLVNGCVLALSELQEPEAVELIFELDSFDDTLGVYKLVERNMNGVLAYTEESGIESLQKIVEAVPVEEFIPVLEAKLMQRSSSEEEQAILEELLSVVEMANSEISVRAPSSSNLDGYAIYRDGVEVPGVGIEINWHTGIIMDSDNKLTSGINDIGHHPGTNGETEITNYKEFLEGNNFMGVYRKTTSISTRKNIVKTAQDMVNESLPYTFVALIKFNNEPNEVNNKVLVNNLTAVRCDGFVEYAYESQGVNIRGGDISTYIGATADNAQYLTFTPKHQAGRMTKVV